MAQCRTNAVVFGVALLLAASCGSKEPAGPSRADDVPVVPFLTPTPTTTTSTPQPTTPTTTEFVGAGGLARLTHLQWELTVQDLFGLAEPTGLSDSFVPDPLMSSFDNDRVGLMLHPTLAQQYQVAAEEVATLVVSDADLLAALSPALERDAWLRSFGERAYRRPLSELEVAELAVLYDEGATVFASGDAQVDGVRASIIGILQSPHFLYRAVGTPHDSDPTRISDHALATKLSYTLWNSSPDEVLLQSAADGTLGSSVDVAVDRLLGHERGHGMIADFHRQWLHIDNYQSIYRISEEVTTTDYSTTLPAAMEREVYAFVDHAVYGGGTVHTLLTSRTTFVNARLGDIYGVTGAETADEKDLIQVELPEGQRAGLLTLTGFLSSHAGKLEANPIRRGGFVLDQLICEPVPPPPSGVPPLPTGESGTLRERVENHTTACGGACHERLNPLGFSMGHYDQTGAWLDAEAGEPVDASGTVYLGGVERSFDGAVELTTILADLPEVHHCYASKLLSYVEGRQLTAADTERVDALAAASLAGRPILDLVRDIVTDPAFVAVPASDPTE